MTGRFITMSETKKNPKKMLVETYQSRLPSYRPKSQYLLLIANLNSILFSLLLSLLAPPAKAQQLIFADEFNGNRIDTTKWDVQSRPNPGNPQSGRFVPRNIEVSNGTLKMHSRLEGSLWTGAALHAKLSGSHGYYEIRARHTRQDDEIWSAFWLVSKTSWPPEMDIFEFSPYSNSPAQANHWRGANNRAAQDWRITGLDETQFHVYGMEWLPGKPPTYYVDGKVSYVTKGPAHTTDMWTVLSTGPGRVSARSCPGGANCSFGLFEVDYVRVYDRFPYK